MPQRSCKENIDYKVLHNTGERITKPQTMSTELERAVVREASCVEDIKDFLECNVVEDIDDVEELHDLMSKLAEISKEFRHAHATLKCYLARDNYEADYSLSKGYSDSMRKFTKEAKEKLKKLKKKR